MAIGLGKPRAGAWRLPSRAALHKPLALVAHALILLATGYLVVSAVWFFAYGPEPAPLAAERVAARDDSQALDIDAIAALHLFGKPAATSAPAIAATEQLQETSLSLVLVGVFAADDGGLSSALIARSGRPAKRYQVGDRLPGNAKLAEVYWDRVVITRGGARELVRFPKVQAIVQAVEPETPPPADSGPLPDRPPALEAAPESASGDEDERAALIGYVDQLPADPQQALQEIGLAPADGAADGGYVVGALADRPELSHTGLQRGDRILSVNGRPLGDPEKDRLQVADIVAAGPARLEVQRGDRQFVVTVALNAFN